MQSISGTKIAAVAGRLGGDRLHSMAALWRGHWL